MKYDWEPTSDYYKRIAQQCYDASNYEDWHYYLWLAKKKRKEEEQKETYYSL